MYIISLRVGVVAQYRISLDSRIYRRHLTDPVSKNDAYSFWSVDIRS